MNDLERAVVDLVRMGVRQDADAIRQYARRLLRRAPTGEGAEGDYREALGEALLDSETVAGPALRRGAAPVLAEPDVVLRGAAGRSGLARGASAAGGHDVVPPADVGSALALVRIEDHAAGPEPVLAPDARAALETLLKERRMVPALREHGVAPSRTVLITGAPGVGKTMAARFLAAALRLPLVSVDLAAVVSSFLGRTGQNLRHVLDFARSRPCVLLLDEFDALAKRRDDQTDVGELKRIVNVLLLELERWPDDGLLVAATNHPELLDRAVWRRFDVVISLGLPDLDARRQIVSGVLRSVSSREVAGPSVAPTAVTPGGTSIDEVRERAAAELCALATEGLSGSDVARLVRSAQRAAALSGRPAAVALADLARAQLATAVTDPDARARVAHVAVRDLGWTQREVGAALGVSHVTVGNWLRNEQRRTERGATRSKGRRPRPNES